MSHIAVLLGLAILLIVLTAALAIWTWYSLSSSAPRAGCIGVILTLPLVVLVAYLLFSSMQDPTKVTVYVAILGTLTAGLAWLVKTTKESLQNRAELLISEGLSRNRMSRDDIRSMIYKNNFMFRVIKSTYVDALNRMLESNRIVLKEGYFVLSSHKDDGSLK